MQCLTFCIAHGINLKKADVHFKRCGVISQLFIDVLQVSLPGGERCFYFANGTVVAWGIKKNQMKAYLTEVLPFCDQPSSVWHRDGFIYRVEGAMSMKAHPYFNVEILTLTDDEDDTKLALSYAFSQSIKLYAYERLMEQLADQYVPLVDELSRSGRIKSSRRRVRKITGEILAVRSVVNLKHGFTYQPKYFWAHPNLEPEFLMLKKYLDISDRVEGLNQQLDMLNEIFVLLSDYLEDRHSHFLEIIIIVLISVEIIFNLLHL